VLSEIDGPVVVVNINRPDVRNAVDRPTAQALTDAFEQSRRTIGWRSLCSRVPDALANEAALGLEVIRSGETRAGAARFAAGEGRHGAGV
jgi:hypothetical protein